MNEITITIKGEPGAGKTTIAQNIAFHLQQRCGMKVLLVENDGKEWRQEIAGAELIEKRSVKIVVECKP